MNSSSTGVWDIPPPPGTEDDQPISDSSRSNCVGNRAIDRIDPFLKNPQYLEYERRSGQYRGRSRSRSNDRYEKHRSSRSRSRSKSRHKHRRSRSSSRSKSHRKRRYSKSRSRSRSRSHAKHSRRDRDKRTKNYSRSRHSSSSRHASSSKHSRSRSRSRSDRSESRSKSHKSQKSTSRSHRSSRDHSDYEEKPIVEDFDHELVDMKVEEEEEADQSAKDNAFKNDGSFLEMFKKMQEEKKAQEDAQKAETEKQKLLPAFGKRRGGRVLKTGMVLKTKQQDNEEGAHDPWSVYMKEVKRYKEACCDDDSKTRPLVK